MVVQKEQMAIELARAMGLPTEDCTSVVIDLPYNDVASIILKYTLTADDLRVALEALSAGQVSEGLDVNSGSAVDPVQDYMQRMDRVMKRAKRIREDEIVLMDRLWGSMTPEQKNQTRILTMKLLSERHG